MVLIMLLSSMILQRVESANVSLTVEPKNVTVGQKYTLTCSSDARGAKFQIRRLGSYTPVIMKTTDRGANQIQNAWVTRFPQYDVQPPQINHYTPNPSVSITSFSTTKKGDFQFQCESNSGKSSVVKVKIGYPPTNLQFDGNFESLSEGVSAVINCTSVADEDSNPVVKIDNVVVDHVVVDHQQRHRPRITASKTINITDPEKLDKTTLQCEVCNDFGKRIITSRPLNIEYSTTLLLNKKDADRLMFALGDVIECTARNGNPLPTNVGWMNATKNFEFGPDNATTATMRTKTVIDQSAQDFVTCRATQGDKIVTKTFSLTYDARWQSVIKIDKTSADGLNVTCDLLRLCKDQLSGNKRLISILQGRKSAYIQKRNTDNFESKKLQFDVAYDKAKWNYAHTMANTIGLTILFILGILFECFGYRQEVDTSHCSDKCRKAAAAKQKDCKRLDEPYYGVDTVRLCRHMVMCKDCHEFNMASCTKCGAKAMPGAFGCDKTHLVRTHAGRCEVCFPHHPFQCFLCRTKCKHRMACLMPCDLPVSFRDVVKVRLAREKTEKEKADRLRDLNQQLGRRTRLKTTGKAEKEKQLEKLGALDSLGNRKSLGRMQRCCLWLRTCVMVIRRHIAEVQNTGHHPALVETFYDHPPENTDMQSRMRQLAVQTVSERQPHLVRRSSETDSYRRRKSEIKKFEDLPTAFSELKPTKNDKGYKVLRQLHGYNKQIDKYMSNTKLYKKWMEEEEARWKRNESELDLSVSDSDCDSNVSNKCRVTKRKYTSRICITPNLLIAYVQQNFDAQESSGKSK